jgi:soluble lytic murein transglycosylase
MIHKILNLLTAFVFTAVLFSVGCSGQTEQQALESLRQMTKEGKLPPEDVVAGIETRFAGKKTGALAKLLHARIRFENQDFAGAAAILNSDEFAKKTSLGDYALWLRGRALQNAGSHAEAMMVLSKLLNDFPNSIRTRDAKLLWATSAIAAGQAAKVPEFLSELNVVKDPNALLLTAKAYEAQGKQPDAIRFYRSTYFYGAGSDAAKEAEAKLATLGQALTPQNAEEATQRAEKLYASKRYADAATAYSDLAANFPAAQTSRIISHRVTILAAIPKMPEAQTAFNAMPSSAAEREEGYRQLVLGYAKAKSWLQARAAADEMRQRFPSGTLVAKTLIDAGLAAREAKNKADEGYFLNTAVASYPNSVDVAQAQFELAWYEHENNNFGRSAQMFIEHLARYVDKDTTNRGKAGYWAARDSEKSGGTANACALYTGVMYRYSANWYGYLARKRLANLKAQGQCRTTENPSDALVAKAIANLKIVTVAAETSTAKELERAEKSDQLSTIGLFDWAIDELNEAKKTANNSPKINLALARHYRLKGDNVGALLALQKSYPDYAQMFPEEMGREEWDIFYPLTNWDQISAWAKHRNLDAFQVAGFIRQETVFNPRAKSGANAYGLMQLLLPTARTIAKKYGSSMMPNSPEDLYQPALNIELGTAYIRDQFDKFGQVEYVAVAYNAGPNRVAPWRATLPPEIDEFVEAIPFKETKGYVQGIIRNSAQYRRLYDDNGNFKANVGTRPLRGEIDSKSREQFAAENPDIKLDDSGE